MESWAKLKEHEITVSVMKTKFFIEGNFAAKLAHSQFCKC